MRSIPTPDLSGRRVVAGAALAALLAAALGLSLRGGRGEEVAPLLVPPEERGSAPAAAVPEPAAAPAPAATSTAEGLRLHGVTASGAIIGYPGGAQRLVLIGRDVRPGLRLQEVRQHHVLLASSAGIIELGFSGPAQPAAPAQPAEAAASAARDDPRREERLQYRFGLEARRSDGRITGFAIRSGVELPVLHRAGLRPGDVLDSVNGQSFDSQEKVEELPGEIAGSYTAEFEFERAGRRLRRSLEINPRN